MAAGEKEIGAAAGADPAGDAAQRAAWAAAGQVDRAQRALAAAAEAAGPVGAQRLGWAQQAEALGAVGLALAWLRAGAAEAPEDAAVAAALAALVADVGEEATAPAAGVAPEREEGPEARIGLEDGDVVRFVHRFVGREGVHARQWVDGPRAGYSPVRRPLTPDVARGHLLGEATLGTYVVRLDETVTFFVVDVDARKGALEATAEDRAGRARLLAEVKAAAQGIRGRLAGLGVPCLWFDSGFKGCHLWGLLAEPLPAAVVHKFGRALRRAVGAGAAWSVEVFPKQGQVAEGGLGNLVKLPLGLHRRSGRWAALLDEDGVAVADPWPALREAPLVGRAALFEAFARLKGMEAGPEGEGAGEGEGAAAVEAPSLPALLADPALAGVLGGCAVVARLVATAVETRRLDHEGQVVLIHSLGHHPAGVALLRALFAHCPEVPHAAQPKRVLRGHPISCARVRARIPQVTASLPCHCPFETLDAYPAPARYLPAGEG